MVQSAGHAYRLPRSRVKEEFKRHGELLVLMLRYTQALITQQVGADVQGRVQGALISMVSLAGIVGPMMFAGTFALFIGKAAPAHVPGAPWLLAAVLLAIGWLVGWRFARPPQASTAG